ncbi:hypothetical protein J6590_072871 [Homalodisca vitripennis]|nr:hypothetical protein J6590_072871 [Homalodisca vitripennis]
MFPQTLTGSALPSIATRHISSLPIQRRHSSCLPVSSESKISKEEMENNSKQYRRLSYQTKVESGGGYSSS